MSNFTTTYKPMIVPNLIILVNICLYTLLYAKLKRTHGFSFLQLRVPFVCVLKYFFEVL